MTSGTDHAARRRSVLGQGLDVRLAIAEHLAREVGDRFTPPEVLRELVAAGQLGRKSGQGCYSWA